MRKRLVSALLLLFFTSIGVRACMFSITNDDKQKRVLIVVDPYHGYVMRIKPGRTETIDPTVKGFMGLLRHPYLDFYVEDKDTPKDDDFKRRYRLIERYCTGNPEENNLKFSDIVKLSTHPTDRLGAKTYPERKIKKLTRKHRSKI